MNANEVPLSGIFVQNGHQYNIELVDFENEIINLLEVNTGEELSLFFPHIEPNDTTYFITSYDYTLTTRELRIDDDDYSNICESLEYVIRLEANNYEEYVSTITGKFFSVSDEDAFESALLNTEIEHIYKTAELALRAVIR